MGRSIILKKMDTTNAPQIIQHHSQSLSLTPYDVKWIPGTARFCLMGQTPRMEGHLEIYQLGEEKLKSLHTYTYGKGFKCGNFGACPVGEAKIAIGEMSGDLIIYDIEAQKRIYKVKAHDKMVNFVDGCGGQDIGYGAPEILTGGRDGCVRLWDPRQTAIVLSLEPEKQEDGLVPDCWAVGFGNSYNNSERVIAAGYDNGDVKLFDLKQNSLIWDTNLKNGVCGLEFDRKDIKMNKLAVTTLEGKIHCYDLRTYHIEAGYAGCVENSGKATIWGARHLPQNRDLYAIMGGDGMMSLFKYHYPTQRQIKDANDKPKGVAGWMEK